MSFLISLPESFSGAAGDIVSAKFYSGKGPKEGDSVVLKKGATEIECQIVSLTSDSFSFKVSSQVTTGKYTFFIKRGSQIKAIYNRQNEMYESVKRNVQKFIFS